MFHKNQIQKCPGKCQCGQQLNSACTLSATAQQLAVCPAGATLVTIPHGSRIPDRTTIYNSNVTDSTAGMVWYGTDGTPSHWQTGMVSCESLEKMMMPGMAAAACCGDASFRALARDDDKKTE